MKRLLSYSYFLIGSILFLGCTDEDTFTTNMSDFDDIEIAGGTYWNGQDGSGQFISGNKIFYNSYISDWNTWSGFAYSNIENYEVFNESAKYSSYTDQGINYSGNYAVAQQIQKIVIDFIKPEEPRSAQITNCTYTALAIKYGYDYAKKFGGRDGSDPDWFKLTIIGIGVDDEITGALDFFLADYRYDDNELDYITDSWRAVDLTDLGVVKRLEFELSSSDAGTPMYFCLDNLKGRIHY